MPELPEVETVRRELETALVGRVVRAARLLRRDVLVMPGDPAGGFSRQRAAPAPTRAGPRALLLGARVASVRRLGKQLFIHADDGRALGAHLGMTGRFDVVPADAPRRAPEAPHTHARWTLDDGVRLAFVDPRRFGGLWSLPTPAHVADRVSGLGADALTIDDEALVAALARAARPVKAALLDQTVLAGVGNIYADEALFRAGVHPLARADHLPREAVVRLAQAVRACLEEALLAGGSTVRDYAAPGGLPGRYQGQHRVYGRAGEACVACGGPLASGRVAQRMTVWCPSCQAEPASIRQTLHSRARAQGLSPPGRG